MISTFFNLMPFQVKNDIERWGSASECRGFDNDSVLVRAN
jgi:hypothetical protein